MPLDAAIPLQGQPAQIQSPLQSVGQLMQLRNAGAEIALRQAQTQTQQAQNADLQAQADQRNRDLTDANTAQAWLKDPSNAAAFGQGKLDGLLGKVQNKTYEGLQKTANEAIEKKLTLDKSQLELHQQKIGIIQRGLDGLNTLPDDAARAQAWPLLKQELQRQGALDEVPAQAIPDTISGKPDEIQSMAAQLSIAKGLTDAALARKKETADTASKQSTADLNAAKIPGEVATGEREQLKTNAMKAALSNPSSANTSIDGIIDPTKHPNENKTAKVAYAQALATTGDPEKALQEVDKIATPIREKDAAMDPAYLRSQLEQHIKEAKVTSDLDLQRTITAAKILRAGDDPSVQNVPTADIARVKGSAQKLDQQYLKAKTAAESLGRILTLAESGNKAAGSNVPLVSVGALNAANGLHRINSAEVTQNTHIGSLYDNVAGWFQGKTEGEPIPQNILENIRELHGALGEGAYQEYTEGLNAINARAGSKLKPVVDAPNMNRGGAVAPIKLKGGRTLTPHTAADAERFRKDHPDLIEQ